MATKKAKPEKPRPDFPLFPHQSGQWAKKIRGRFHYFGRWAEPDNALSEYLRVRDYLLSGRTPPPKDDTRTTVRDACNRFLTTKKSRLDVGELEPRTFHDYFKTCERLCEHFGKEHSVEDLTPDDFEKLRAKMTARWGPTTIGNEIQRVKTIFGYAFNVGLIDVPVRFGPEFKRPSRRIVRLARLQSGLRMFEADELRQILDAASNPLRAMILLGINCGFGQTDCSGLTFDDLQEPLEWLDVARQKTGIARRCQLWPETRQAIRKWLEVRRTVQPLDRRDRDIVFLTKQGRRFVRVNERQAANGAMQTPVDTLGPEFAKLLKRLGLKRPGLNFYGLRRGFETIGGESRDQVAVDAIMGHVDPSMAGIYRQRISDERLAVVSDTVRRWLFGDCDGTK